MSEVRLQDLQLYKILEDDPLTNKKKILTRQGHCIIFITLIWGRRHYQLGTLFFQQFLSHQ